MSSHCPELVDWLNLSGSDWEPFLTWSREWPVVSVRLKGLESVASFLVTWNVDVK